MEEQTIYFIEWRGGRQFAWFKINLPTERQPGFYRQNASVQAFQQRLMSYCRGGTVSRDSDRCFVRQSPREWTNDRQIWLVTDPGADPMAKVPHAEFWSVWDFYDTVGYDHRKGRFINPDAVRFYRTEPDKKSQGLEVCN